MAYQHQILYERFIKNNRSFDFQKQYVKILSN